MALRDVSKQRKKIDITMQAEDELEVDAAHQTKAEEIQEDSTSARIDLDKLKSTLPDEQLRVLDLHFHAVP